MGIQINGQTDTISAVDGSITVATDLTVPGALTYDDVTNIDSVGVVTARSGLNVTGGSVGIGTDNPISNLQVFGTNGIRITNSANQSATTLLNFESNHPAFRMLNTSGNTTVKFKSDGDSFITGGNLGIGTDNPSDKLSIYAAPNSLVLGAKDTSRGNHIFQLLADDSAGNGELRLYQNSGSGTHAKTVEIASSGNSYFTGGNLGIGINNPPNLLTLGASGGPTMRLADTTSGAFSIITGGSNGGLTFSADHGNTGSSTNIIFSNDGNQERLRITSDGKFGYGTATPGCFFEVSDDAAGATVQQKLINRNTAANSSTNQFIYVNNSGNAGDPFTTWTVGGVTSWSMGIDNSDSDKLKIAAASNLNSNQYLTLDTSGNIGINKTPYTKLDIHNGSDASVIVSIEGADSSSEYLGFGINSGEAVITAGGNGSTSNALVFRTAPSGTETERLRIKSNGVVQIGDAGLGSDNGSRRLEVIGSGNSQAGIFIANNAVLLLEFSDLKLWCIHIRLQEHKFFAKHRKTSLQVLLELLI